MEESSDLDYLRDHWVAIGPRGGGGLVVLRNGRVVVDFDADVGDLCARIEREGRRSLEIMFCTVPQELAA